MKIYIVFKSKPLKRIYWKFKGIKSSNLLLKCFKIIEINDNKTQPQTKRFNITGINKSEMRYSVFF